MPTPAVHPIDRHHELLHALVDAQRATTIAGYGSVLLQAAISQCGAEAGEIYFLRISDGSQQLFASRPDETEHSRPIITPEDLADLTNKQLPSQITASTQPEAATAFLLPIIRDENCVGALSLYSRSGDAFVTLDMLAESLQPVTTMLGPVHDRLFIEQLVADLQFQLDFSAPYDDFVSELITLASIACQAEVAVVREHDDTGALLCIGTYGLGAHPRSEFDLHGRHDAPAVFDALESPNGAFLDAMEATGRNSHRLTRKSVCLPITSNGRLFGTLSLGHCNYQVSRTLFPYLHSVAATIGTAIASYRSFNEASTQLGDLVHTASVITSLEIARSARHEVRGLLDDCMVLLSLLSAKVDRGASNRRFTEVDDLESRLLAIGEAMDRIKVASRPPSRDPRHAALRQTWEDAVWQTSGRLWKAGVRIQYVGPDVNVTMAPDWLRVSLLNLLVNSADAFEARRNRKERRITLSVKRPGAREKVAEAVYSDNAGGIDFSRLRQLGGSSSAHRDTLTAASIFDAEVSSKPAGSGWGLTLTRHIVASQGGSIDLLRHRDGLSFRLQLPLASTGRAVNV